MSVIKIFHSKSKTNKKPGWQKAAAEEAAWLKGLQALTVSTRPKTISVTPKAPVKTKTLPNRPLSLMTPGITGTIPVSRPDILYKDNPEMLARELQARSRKFNVAPAFNKGAAQFVTEEELVNQLIGNKRR